MFGIDPKVQEQSVDKMMDFLELGLLDLQLEDLLNIEADYFVELRIASKKMVDRECEDFELFRLSMITAFDYLTTGGFVSNEISYLAREILMELDHEKMTTLNEDELEIYLDKTISKQFRLGAMLLINEADHMC